MSIRRHALLLAAILPAVGGCSGPPPAPAESNQIGSVGAPAVTVAPDQSLPTATETDYVGTWTGVEGMVLTVAARPGGGVTIDNQWDLDHNGRFFGSVTARGLRWLRGGKVVNAVRSDGDATGLKYLAGKKDCLTVAPGEGYCRS